MNMMVIGNLVSLAGCLLMVAVGFIRKKSHILAAQCVQFGFMGFGNLLLGGTSGFISNMVGIARNLVFAKFRTTTALKIFFILLQLLLSLSSLGDGLISGLPIIAAAIFTWSLDTKSEAKLKVVIITTQVLWLIYDLYYRNYVATTFDVLTMGSNIIGFFMVRKSRQ